MLTIDGALHSGSGCIVRQAMGLAALTQQPLHLVHARARRSPPGLRLQHLRAVEAIAQLVDGAVEGAQVGSEELTFWPGPGEPPRTSHWDIGSAGSTTMMALAVLPVLAFAPQPTDIELIGGLFQDFAPTYFHLCQVVVPLLNRLGFAIRVDMARPGYVPTGGGILRIQTEPVAAPLKALSLEHVGPVERIWGIALASHLAERKVSARMADAAQAVLSAAGYTAEIELQEDTSALQRGAAMALFADCPPDVRLGADRAGAPRRSSEAVGRYAARRLLEDLASAPSLDRYAADQVILFAALAAGQSRFRIPAMTDHATTSAWLAQEILGSRVAAANHSLTIDGIGFRSERRPVVDSVG